MRRTGLQIAERHFQAEGEEHERHADFGKDLDVVNLQHGRPGGVRSHQNTRGDVPHKERQSQCAGEQTAQQPGDDHQHEVGCDVQALIMGDKMDSLRLLTSLIEALHYTIGIRTPPPDQVRKIALVWLISMVTIVLTLFLLLKYAF